VTTPVIFNDQVVPGLSTMQMIEVDRAMIQDFRIELIQMMENAAMAGELLLPRGGCTTGALLSLWYSPNLRPQ